MNPNRKSKVFNYRFRQHGLTLIELMVACTIGILIVLAMSYLMMNSLQTRNELIKTSRQIENGRYAMEELRKEIQLAGFYGSYFPAGITNWTTPDPCAISRNSLEFRTQPTLWVPVGIQGFTQSQAAPSCIENHLAGTDILVVRRVITEPIEVDVDGDDTIDVNVQNAMGNAFYLQVSNCPDLAMEPPFVVSNAANISDFSLHKVTPVGDPALCTNGHRSEIWRYATYLFYIRTCNDCRGSGDGIPTLMMVEVSPNATPRPIAEGIQNMQIEYGFDTNNDGTPDLFEADIGAGPPARQWQDAVAVKVFLLARNVETTPGHRDEKIYLVGSDGSTVGPFNDNIRRQAYVTTTMAHNIAGRRLQ